MPMCDVFDHVPVGLAPAIRRQGFTSLTKIQSAVVAPDCAGRELRLSSKTGSGKTVALGMVLARDLLEDGPLSRDGRGPRGLVIAPTRELAAQLAGELTWLYHDVGLRLAVVTGGIDIRRDFRDLHRNPEIVVGTPGRLFDHLQRGSLDLSNVASVVLDEADEMLDMGFRDELEGLLDVTPSSRRTHMVSATFPRKVLHLANRYQSEPLVVEGSPAGAANSDIHHAAYLVGERDRLSALINILLEQGQGRTLVFARTRADTADLAADLVQRGFAAAPLNGDMGQRERTATLAAFRAGTVQVLVATDVAARGLDVDDIDAVVHFELPENDEVFTHRSGRTGRAGRRGRSLLLSSPRQRARVAAIFRRLGIRAEWLDVPQPAQVRQAVEKRLIEELSGQVSEELDHRELAEELLLNCDPLSLVQALLGRSGHLGPCAPVVVEQPKRKPLPAARAHQGGGAPGHSGPRPRAPRQDGAFVPFFVNWGAKGGANPSRLLAMVCRRGNLKSPQIGAIRIAPQNAVVEVAREHAAAFEQAAGRPDPRNPKVHIRPWREDTQRSPRPKAHVSHKRHQGAAPGRDRQSA